MNNGYERLIEEGRLLHALRRDPNDTPADLFAAETAIGEGIRARDKAWRENYWWENRYVPLPEDVDTDEEVSDE